ncbi:MAG TPA: hypothetical protein DCZ95_17410 [Verrucomicrobia bacterium]|nr:MAG: hypothetical protein A2X46_17480 [Lentisphaerae bacterium GWF2_57_35]HBA85864.1 hypothetical protein [Verrucomicrobiota bacterium]
MWKSLALCFLLGFALPGFFGCATPVIETARYDFFSGHFQQSEQALGDETKVSERDRVLFFMERGTVRQAMGQYDKSAKDFIAASDLLDQLETYSVSKGGASMVVNDTVQNFRGMPFERTALHSFAALDHFALADWDSAAVEARRILKTLDPGVLGKYPDDAFARYVAGFAFEMIDDPSNASMQYRKASEISGLVQIDENTGRLQTRVNTNQLLTTTNNLSTLYSTDENWSHELVCFVLSGRSPSGEELLNGYLSLGTPEYAEIVINGKTVGRSYALADTGNLALRTQQIDAAMKAIKTASRIALKEGLAQAVEHNSNGALGALTRLVLIGLMERPDTRRWETMPRWLQVARIPCPPDLKKFDVVFKSWSGATLRTIKVTAPISRRRQTIVSFCRDIYYKP